MYLQLFFRKVNWMHRSMAVKTRNTGRAWSRCSKGESFAVSEGVMDVSGHPWTLVHSPKPSQIGRYDWIELA
jgi:hypothetical protein